MVDHLPSDPGVVIVPKAPTSQTDSRWASYPFINSITGLVGEHTDGLRDRYSHILRSDSDVFLTRHLVHFRPQLYVFGRGRYAQLPEVRDKIGQFAARYGLQHHGIFNCGSSLLGPADGVLAFLYNQSVACEWLWEEFKDNPGTWPGWSKNTLTMYAAEIVANHYHDRYTYNGYFNVLDFETYREDVIDDNSAIYHIHALHTDAYWSKFRYRAGDYAGADIGALNRGVVNQYCHWLSEVSTGEVKALVGYPF
jgi:hypothetical protein